MGHDHLYTVPDWALMRRMSGRVFAVASGKGGVGKTTTVANLGVMIRSAGNTVAVVDGDLGMPNLGTLLGITPDVTLHAVLAGEATVEDAIVSAGEGFSVLAGGDDLDEFAAADPGELGTVIAALAETHDYVLIDTSAGLSYEGVLPLGLVDGIVLITTPDKTAIGDTAKTAKFAETIDGRIEGVVVTRTDGSVDGEEIAEELAVELLGVVPEDEAVSSSRKAGEPLLMHAPESPAGKAYRRLAATLTGEEIPDSGTIAGLESAAGETESGEDEEDTDSTGDQATTDDSGGVLTRLFGVFR